MNERKDAATLQRLETAWSIAYLKGDAEFERCLLTADFTEILGSGEIAVLKDELGFAEANQDKNLSIPDLPKSTILLHGNAAVAYGTSRGKEHVNKYADYYLWESGAWHVYFAQQTRVQQSLASRAEDFPFAGLTWVDNERRATGNAITDREFEGFRNGHGQ